MMTIVIGPELERIIREKVDSGEYRSPDEVVGAALLLLDGLDEEEFDESDLEELRREVAIGIEDVKHGRVTDGPTAFATLLRKLDQRESDQ